MATPNDNERIVEQRRRNGSTRRLWPAGVALLMLLGVLLIPFFRDNETTITDTGATVGEIARDPAGFAGRVVTVSGEVAAVLDTRTVVLGGPRFIGADELLVVCVTSLPAVSGRRPDMPVEVNDILQVTGLVRPFELAAIEDEIGADLDDASFQAWVSKPVLVARVYHITPRQAAE